MAFLTLRKYEKLYITKKNWVEWNFILLRNKLQEKKMKDEKCSKTFLSSSFFSSFSSFFVATFTAAAAVSHITQLKFMKKRKIPLFQKKKTKIIIIVCEKICD
jgi:hypothetical protein